VREALTGGGCVVCQLALRSVSRLIKSVAHEQVNDLGLRQELRLAHGFCNQHAHQWLREARNVLGTALIYRDVLQSALRDLDAVAPSNGQRGRLLRGLLGATDHGERQAMCPACRVQFEAEARYLEALLASVAADQELRAAFGASQGLCRRHALAAQRIGGPAADCVAEVTRRAVEALVRDLDEIIRKEDYRFRHEARTDSERTAPARAIAWAAGIDGLVVDD
jgi:hypothetical protein